MDIGFSPRDFLLTLLLKVTVAASIAALLARWNTLRRVLFTEERDVDQKIKLMFFLTPPLILGVTLRLVGAPYRFADLSLEGAFLMGLLGGRVVGPIGGAIITVPALIAHEPALPGPFTLVALDVNGPGNEGHGLGGIRHIGLVARATHPGSG